MNNRPVSDCCGSSESGASPESASQSASEADQEASGSDFFGDIEIKTKRASPLAKRQMDAQGGGDGSGGGW